MRSFPRSPFGAARPGAHVPPGSNEIDQPNNSECDDERGEAKAQHITDVMPSYALSRSERGKNRALLRLVFVIGRSHSDSIHVARSSTQTLSARSGSGLLPSLTRIGSRKSTRINRASSKKKSPVYRRGISIYRVENLAVLLTLLAAVLTTLLTAALLLSALTTRCLILLTGFLLTTLLMAALLFATHYVSP